jgi:hypothetical protein
MPVTIRMLTSTPESGFMLTKEISIIYAYTYTLRKLCGVAKVRSG